jgi:hypothetical protein
MSYSSSFYCYELNKSVISDLEGVPTVSLMHGKLGLKSYLASYWKFRSVVEFLCVVSINSGSLSLSKSFSSSETIDFSSS